ncbi:histone deacetylase 6-like [Ruditapes philippinarum]|uniref:histone deacetylase 6-like n=1 Tax=Ruditapes philippinarum TaxID=129788 RepID=UPI00295BE922|nr:histone deacetylase 6-like [Ruditapes philippinarum]
MAFSEGVRTGLVYDERLSRHFNSWNPKFVEVPERVTDPFAVCEKYLLVDRCKRIECRPASDAEMVLKHSSEMIEKLKSTHDMTEDDLKEMSTKYDYIYFHPCIFENAQLALGGTIELVTSVLRDEVRNGMAIIRPPGHHAQHNTYCGYCYFNNVATAAQVALDDFGLQRILIVDWDVHHGQGTQYMFYDDPRVIYFSIHTYDYGREWPFLRESDYDYIGTGPGRGYNINVPLNKTACGNEEYMAIFQQILLPIAYEFSPELILVSAGYDSAIGCPEGLMEVTPAMYAHFISLLSSLATGKICLIQEGGYCLKSLSESIALSLRALLGDPAPMVQDFKASDDSVVESILNVIKLLRPYWKCLQFQDTLKDSEQNGYLDLPPKEGVEFYTDCMPESFDLYQPCYEEDYEDQRHELYEKIDALIRNTNLHCAPNSVGIVTDSNMLLHRDPSGLCEETDRRLSVCCDTLRSKGFWKRCQTIPERQATTEELSVAHTPDYIKLIRKTSGLSEESIEKYQSTFQSVYLCKDTYLAATSAVGCLLSAVDNVLIGKSQASVAVIRPPGHHAEPNAACGFCIFNNVAIAAKYIRQQTPTKRVLIVDWDLHHGNGTQLMFYDDPSVLFISIHRHDCGKYFPCGCYGSSSHVGRGQGRGYNVNIPWNNGTRGDGDYIAAFNQIVMPIAYQFGPDIVLVSAGFDACVGDMLGHYEVTPACYAHLTAMLKTLANGNLIMALEGGYNIECTANAMSICVSVLLGDAVPSVASVVPCNQGVADIMKVLDVQKKYWSALKYREALPTTKQLESVLAAKEAKKLEQTRTNEECVNAKSDKERETVEHIPHC